MTLPSPQPNDNTNLAHALGYAALGWRVVPITPGGKRPSLPAWQDEATTDPEVLTFWWRRWPDHGVGIVAGKASGLFVLDVDPDHGGSDTLAELEAQHGALPDTVEAITGGGGRHILFAWPTLNGTEHLRNSAGRLGPGLDIRAEGGQIVAAPTVHPTTGRPYQWELSSMPGDMALAEAPGWLLGLLTETAEALPEGQVEGSWDPRFAWDRANGHPQVQERTVALLERHGWHSPTTDRRGVTYLTRPGKARGDGPGVSVGKVAPGVAYCFTSEAPPLEAERGYRFAELLAVLEHQGDRSAADEALARSLGGARTHPGTTERRELEAWIDYQHSLATIDGDTGASQGVDTPAEDHGPTPIDWPAFWTREHVGEDWLVRPLLPRGRQVALWASHKTGKSLVTLEVAAALATGRAVLAQEAGDPVGVVYLDMEMTEDDLYERLEEMGYGPEDDLSRLHYYLLPSLPSLDTEAGGVLLAAIAERHGAQLVVIDTFSRVIEGEENAADTVRAFYRHCGLRLKAMGVSVLRLDHGGKDPTKGQRGTSGKGDDVDVVFQLLPDDSGLKLKRTVARMSWVPEAVVLERQEGPLRHVVKEGLGFPAGTKAVAEEMLELGIDCVELSQRAAIAAYRDAGRSAENRLLTAAHKHLRAEGRRRMGEALKPWAGGAG